MDTVNEALFKAAAEGWCQAILNPDFVIPDDSYQVTDNEKLARQRALEKRPDEAALAAFTQNLIAIIKKSSCMKFGYAVLRVDYDPDENLTKAASLSGIDPCVFPWKTIMRLDVNKQEITFKKGYKGKEKQVYPKLDKAA